jgi:hypothetical protein
MICRATALRLRPAHRPRRAALGAALLRALPGLTVGESVDGDGPEGKGWDLLLLQRGPELRALEAQDPLLEGLLDGAVEFRKTWAFAELPPDGAPAVS